MPIKSILLIPLFILNFHLNSQSIVVSTWTIGDYKIELIEEGRQKDVEFDTRQLPPSMPNRINRKYRFFSIQKNDPSWSHAARIDVSADSCKLTFLEFTAGRPRNGHVGNKIKLDLCHLKLSSSPVIKPSIDPARMSHAEIRPLDSLFYQPYPDRPPLKVVEYNGGASRTVHEKNVIGLNLFLESMSLTNEFKAEEFVGQSKPHFEVTWIEDNKKRKLILYWNLFIIDGFIYSNANSYGDAFDIRFWEANLKLLNDF